MVGTGLLLTAYALIALGIGTILRHSGASIATGVGLLFLPFLFLGAFPERIAVRIQQLTPLAGMAVQSTTDRMLVPSTVVPGCRSVPGRVSVSPSRGRSAPSPSATSCLRVRDA